MKYILKLLYFVENTSNLKEQIWTKSDRLIKARIETSQKYAKK